MASMTMTIRLESEIKNRLNRLADITHRSSSYLAAEAINEYLKTQEWQLHEIIQGISEADEGQLVDHEAIVDFWEHEEQ